MPRGRRKEYTRIGISRVPCARCGKPSRRQWQVCANGNRYLGVCEGHDIELNEMVLRFFHFKDVDALINSYTATGGTK